METIHTVLILGAGTMGIQIGVLCAAAGFDVIIILGKQNQKSQGPAKCGLFEAVFGSRRLGDKEQKGILCLSRPRFCQAGVS